MADAAQIGRVPPHSEEAEQAVIAACLVGDVWPLSVAADVLTPGSFYHRRHGVIFEAMLDLQQRGRPVDVTTLREALGPRIEAAGGAGYLYDMAGAIPTTAHIEHYAAIVAEKASRREAIRIHQEALAALYDPDTEDPTTDALGKLMTVTASGGPEGATDFHEVLLDAFEAIDEAAKNPGKDAPAAFRFGLYDLDQLVNVEFKDMVIVAARPSAGKTALALQVMTHVAAGKPVLFFSLEMGKEAIAKRYFSQASGVSARRQGAGRVSRAELDAIGGAYQTGTRLRYVIDDRPALSVAQMAATAQRQAVRLGEPLGLIVVDHMGKVKPNDPKASKHHQLSQVSNDLKTLAKRLGTPVLALNQLNRDVEKGGGREPVMADIRESGSIEEDADVIILLHRPERDKSFTNAKLIVAKNRNGPLGTIELSYDAQHTLFTCEEGNYGHAN